MPVSTVAATRTSTTSPTLSFDQRLQLAVMAIDAKTNTAPFDLADVIRIPVEAPAPAPQPSPYRTPLAALLHRAHTRLTEGGWCTGRRRDEQGAMCLDGVIRAEATTAGEAVDALTLLLDVIRAEFDPTAETVPSWNDALRDGRMPARVLDRAASVADARGI